MNNYDYPLGSDTKDAPWNQTEPDEMEFDVCVSQSLSKSISIKTKDYVPMVDETEDGDYLYADTEDTNWKEAYTNEHWTPLELIEEFKHFLENELEQSYSGKVDYIKYMIEECSNWIEDETDVVKE